MPAMLGLLALAPVRVGHAASTVVGWGRYFDGGSNFPVTIPSGLSNVVAIAAGYQHSLALTADGRMVGWGNNAYGQIGNSAPTTASVLAPVDVTALASGAAMDK